MDLRRRIEKSLDAGAMYPDSKHKDAAHDRARKRQVLKGGIASVKSLLVKRTNR